MLGVSILPVHHNFSRILFLFARTINSTIVHHSIIRNNLFKNFICYKKIRKMLNCLFWLITVDNTYIVPWVICFSIHAFPRYIVFLPQTMLNPVCLLSYAQSISYCVYAFSSTESITVFVFRMLILDFLTDYFYLNQTLPIRRTPLHRPALALWRDLWTPCRRTSAVAVRPFAVRPRVGVY